MTFYQELQLDQVGSKSYIASITDPKEKRKHIAIYLFKIFINRFVLRCFCYYLHKTFRSKQ